MSHLRPDIKFLERALRVNFEVLGECPIFALFSIHNKEFANEKLRELLQSIKESLEVFDFKIEKEVNVFNVFSVLASCKTKHLYKWDHVIVDFDVCYIRLLAGRLENVLFYLFYNYHSLLSMYEEYYLEKFCMFKLCPDSVEELITSLNQYLEKLKHYGDKLLVLEIETLCCCCSDDSCLGIDNFGPESDFWYDKPFWGLNGESIRRLDNIVQLLIKELDPGLMIGHLEPYIMAAITLKIDLTKIEALIKYVKNSKNIQQK